MKNILQSLIVTLVCAGCASDSGFPKVTFEYFNLSTNEIWVTEVAGFPPNATPGRLMTSRDENPLEVKASVFSETVRIRSKIIIVWKDGGKQGWPGGLKSAELVPSGIAYQAAFKRDDLGIPAKLSSGRIRFTYLGNEKWRVKLLK
jgi:hypothetical protein